MKRIKIKDWVHAIDLTIKRHSAVLKGKYPSYNVAKETMKPSNWDVDCPLCEYAMQITVGYMSRFALQNVSNYR